MHTIQFIIAKFTEEVITLNFTLLALVATYYIYAYVLRRRSWIGTEWVPGSIVKDFLEGHLAKQDQVHMQLFGEPLKGSGGSAGMGMSAAAMGAAASPQIQTVTVADPNVQKELDAVRVQLSSADQKSQELAKELEDLKAANDALAKEKEELAKKAAEGGGGGGGEADAELIKERDELKAKLEEYEVIEDDLANLKKYQIENKELREKLNAAGGGGGEAAPAAAEAPKAEPAAEAPAEAEAPAAEAAPAAESEAAPAEEKPAAEGGGENKEEELLSEFEKMLAS